MIKTMINKLKQTGAACLAADRRTEIFVAAMKRKNGKQGADCLAADRRTVILNQMLIFLEIN
jgi:hypothetical protein